VKGHALANGVQSTLELLEGRYLLERELGRGGMAVVYEAVDRRLDRRVAVKVVPDRTAEPSARHLFIREARSAAGFNHPNAVAVYDAGETDEYLYLVMELVEGRTLADLIASDSRLDATHAVGIASSVLSALGQAHASGIVHRDVKPSNIMLTGDGRVKLLDFGIASRLDELAHSVTDVGEIIGTPKYLAPEQVAGRPSTATTDLYAVGVVLFEMLAGTAPFVGDTPTATAFAHVTADPPDLSALRPDIPSTLVAAIRRAMAKEPTDRFGDAAEMQRALHETNSTASTSASQPTSLVESTQVMPLAEWHTAKSPRWWLIAVGVLVLAATALVWYLTRGDAGTSPTDATPTTLAATTAPPTTVPATIEGVIAALRSDPERYGEHTAVIVDELTKIQQGDAVSARADALLQDVAAWVESGEIDPSALAMLEPILSPLAAPVDNEADSGNGNGNGGGNGNGNSGEAGNGNGNGRGNGNGKKN
jgi:hypothetical protein